LWAGNECADGVFIIDNQNLRQQSTFNPNVALFPQPTSWALRSFRLPKHETACGATAGARCSGWLRSSPSHELVFLFIRHRGSSLVYGRYGESLEPDALHSPAPSVFWRQNEHFASVGWVSFTGCVRFDALP
jgi:hypothetical protein